MTARGLQSVLNVLAVSDVRVVADLTGLEPQVEPYLIELTGSLVNVRGASIVGIEPARIRVQIARRAEQLKEVTVSFTQEPPIGYTITTTPAQREVLVVGAVERVKDIDRIEARVSIGAQRGTFSQNVPLIPVNAAGEVVQNVILTPSETSITIELQPRSDVTELAIEPRLIGELPNGYLRVNQVWQPRRVFVRGNQEAINALNGVLFTEPINLADRTATFSQTVGLNVPSGVTLLDPQPVTVTIEIEAVQGSREFTGIPVQVQGIDTADFSVTLTPDRVNVIVRGPQVVLDTLKAEDVRVYVDLVGRVSGTHRMPLSGTVAQTDPQSVTVIIPNDQVEVVITPRTPDATPTLPATSNPEGG